MKTASRTVGLLAMLGALAVLGCAQAPNGLGTGGNGHGVGGGNDGGGGSGEDGGGPGGEALCGPLTDQGLDSLTPCCAEYGGAHCLAEVPIEFQTLVAPCDGGGFCVPDDFILDGGAVEPESCLSLGDADGRWISGCLPEVAMNAGLLPTDEAHPGLFCVPCVNPIDQQSTGVCEIGTTCDGGGGTGGTGGSPGGGATCDEPGAPIDPSLFAACPNACGGRCVDKQLLPNPDDPSIQQLAECAPGSGQLCVPEEMIASKGLGVPETCDWYGLEGRCMSECIPEIAEQAQSHFVVQGTCPEHHFCTPCSNPLTDEPTGACSLECDAGPDPAKAHDLPTCCDGIGTCVPGALAGDQADQLGEDTCGEDSGLICAPNDLMPGSNYVPADCEPDFNLVDVDPDHKYGVCLPGCLPALDSLLLSDSGACGDKYKCAPCWQPGIFSDKKSDAPGCVY